MSSLTNILLTEPNDVDPLRSLYSIQIHHHQLSQRFWSKSGSFAVKWLTNWYFSVDFEHRRSVCKMRTNKLISSHCKHHFGQLRHWLLTSWNIAAICSIVLFSYCRHSVTGIEYGVLLHKRMQWFCTWNRCSSRISFISSKHTRAVANPSAKFAFDSLLPPLKLQNRPKQSTNKSNQKRKSSVHEKKCKFGNV